MDSTQPARGTRDFLPDDVRRREYVMGVVRRTYERYGFEPIETPAFENLATLMGKYGEEGNQLIFKILKRGEHEASGQADLALRYDLTVPLARVVAQYQSVLPALFKRYQIQPVWRADRPARGRFREFYQCDIDAIGSTSPVVEVELLAAASDVLAELGFQDFVIRLNHRRLLSGLLEGVGIETPLHGTALTALDKLDKIGVDAVVADMAGRGIADHAARALTATLAGGAAAPDEIWPRLRAAVGTHPAGVAGLAALEEIVSLASATAANGRIRVDPSLARGLSYYTGAIMEVAVADLPGSLGGGGRYDDLIGMFLGRAVPACGFSLGLERIIVVMGERGMFPAAVDCGAADVVVTFLDAESRAEVLGLARELRQSGLRVDVYPEVARKVEKALKYAAGRRAPWLAIVGPDERAKGEVALRDLTTRVQRSVGRGALAATIGAGANAASKER